ncbi:MAG: HAMP domain-containing sensor histidine kinase [Gemmatimonadaceae bacterium]
MKAPRYDLASNRKSRQLSSKLWWLAALLGLMSVVHMVGVVHDNRAWRTAMYSVAQSTAEQHAERVNERLQAYAMETFAPVVNAGVWAIESVWPPDLVRGQQAGERCRCRNLLPVMEFFAVTPVTGKISRLPSGGKFSEKTALSDSQLVAIARLERQKPDASQKNRARLYLNSTIGSLGIVTWTTPTDDEGTVVVGLIGNGHDLIKSLFSGGSGYGDGTDSLTGVTYALDTMSVQVSNRDAVALFGRVDTTRKYRAHVIMHGPMEGLSVAAAIDPSQGGYPQPSQPSSRLWALGFLTLATIVVIAIAVSASNREMFVARARSDFIAGTSHDLRMPLAQILLASETLTMRDDIPNGTRDDLTKSIVRETRRLIGMVENVLLFSRSGAVEIKPALQTLNVGEVFSDVVESVQLAIDDVGQTIVTDVASSITVRADRQLLRQALVNLVDNAIKYGKEKQRIVIGGKQRSPSLVQLWVDDDGPGIPESQRERVFEPYERLTRDQASERAGSGLGLAVAYHIAKVNGGRIWIESAPSGGARVVLELTSAHS